MSDLRTSDGFFYKIHRESGEQLKEIWDNTRFFGEFVNASYEIKDDLCLRLLTITRILEKAKLDECDSNGFSVGEVSRRYVSGKGIVEFVYIVYKLNEKIRFNGSVYCNQIYCDEVYKTHNGYGLGQKMESVSNFTFQDGKFVKELSSVTESTSRFIERFTWSPELDCNSVKENEIYFVDPVGTYIENMVLLDLIICYTLRNIKQKDLVDQLLAYEKPIISTRYKVKRNGVFVEVYLDLTCLVLERYYEEREYPKQEQEAIELLKIIYPYVEDEKQKIQIREILSVDKN